MYVPGEQSVVALACASVKEPAGVSVHDVEPLLAAYLPDGQFVQEEEPEVDVYVPGGQDIAAVACASV